MTSQVPVEDARGGDCPRCGAPYEAFQEYCLECGLRLPLARGFGSSMLTAWRRRVAYYPGDWVWPILVALVVAALSAATVIAVKAADDDEVLPFLVPTDGTVGPLPTATGDTSTIGAPPTLPTTPPPTQTQTQTTPPPGRLRQWPAGTNGFTVVLASLPKSGGRAAATAKAKEASDAGLPDVGVLDSDEFSSLHPGYYVVFSGIYDSRGEADSALSQATAQGFDAAYARQIIS